MEQFAAWIKNHPRWSIAITVIVALFVYGAIAGEEEKPAPKAASGKPADEAKPAVDRAAEPTSSTPAKSKPPKEPSQKQKVKTALDNIDGTVEDPVIKKVEFGDELTIYAKTPEGGIQGASTGDLNRQAGDIFQAIYGPAGYKKSGATIVFRGGLVDTETGKDLNRVNTGIFSISKRQARRIDWSDDDAVKYTIDWTNYRDFAHPALKQDD